MIDDLDPVFQAVASPIRRYLLDLLKERPGLSVGELANEFDISRIAVINHLRILENANLINSIKRGRKRLLYFNSVPIQMICDRWTSEYSKFWSSQLADFKYKIEQGITNESSKESSDEKKAK